MKRVYDGNSGNRLHELGPPTEPERAGQQGLPRITHKTTIGSLFYYNDVAFNTRMARKHGRIDGCAYTFILGNEVIYTSENLLQ
jgi:hypothetical protein